MFPGLAHVGQLSYFIGGASPVAVARRPPRWLGPLLLYRASIGETSSNAMPLVTMSHEPKAERGVVGIPPCV